MTATGEARIHSLPEALSRLASPYAHEELATLTGEGVLVVDLPTADGPALTERVVSRTVAELARLACPTIAIVPRDCGVLTGKLAGAFDVWLESAEELSRVLQAIRTNPMASLALAQLLRHNAMLDVHEGLIAESLVYSTLQSGEEFGAWRAGRTPRTIAEPMQPVLRVERDGRSLRLTFDWPERHNAFGVALRDAFVEALALAASDDTIEQIALAANGPSFCSGGDLDEFGSLPDPATAHAVRSIRHPGRLLSRLAERVRVELHGACIGAGVELPAFAARVTARADAFFQLPEVAMGLVPGAGGTVSLPRRIGRQRTAWMAITGERVDAETGLRWGIFDALA